jgi:hypothetical protein
VASFDFSADFFGEGDAADLAGDRSSAVLGRSAPGLSSGLAGGRRAAGGAAPSPESACSEDLLQRLLLEDLCEVRSAWAEGAREREGLRERGLHQLDRLDQPDSLDVRDPLELARRGAAPGSSHVFGSSAMLLSVRRRARRSACSASLVGTALMWQLVSSTVWTESGNSLCFCSKSCTASIWCLLVSVTLTFMTFSF